MRKQETTGNIQHCLNQSVHGFISVTPSSPPSVGFGGQCDVSRGGNGDDNRFTHRWLEEVHLEKKRVGVQQCARSSQSSPMLLTHLTAYCQQRVQNHYGHDRSHGRHLGVVTDNGPEGKDQDRARDCHGDQNQRPAQPLKWDDP